MLQQPQAQIPLPITNNQNPQPVATEATTSDLKPIEGEKVDLRIMSTTDLHTNLVNYDYYQDKESQKIGLAKTAVLIEEAKKENPNTVLVDNGDVIQGTPLGTYKAIVKPVAENEEHPMYQAMNALGYDASTLGNHEFNYGLDYLKKSLLQPTFQPSTQMFWISKHINQFLKLMTSLLKPSKIQQEDLLH